MLHVARSNLLMRLLVQLSLANLHSISRALAQLSLILAGIEASTFASFYLFLRFRLRWHHKICCILLFQILQLSDDDR